LTQVKQIEELELALINAPVFKSTADTAEELVEATQLAALNEYNYVSDVEGNVYQIIAEDEADIADDYCHNCHNLQLIDQIINNTLTQEDNITPQQADTALKLAQLKHILGAHNGL